MLWIALRLFVLSLFGELYVCWGLVMPGSRDADLVAIKARLGSNYALVASAPKIASNRS
jgi:hypothetical protein